MLGRSIGLSHTQVHQAHERLVASRLLRAGSSSPIRSSLVSVLTKGVPYFLPAPPQGDALVRGVATGCCVAPLPGSDAQRLVWPDEEGQAEGYAVQPLCTEAVQAARLDPQLHQLLALTDLVRSHRSSLRERSLAAQRLEHLILEPVAMY
ncbi:MarR family transcriptional regulator [Deinococcus radiophilus]|uniref:MarR family transcriptional regulator n=1 Tax=Deinococcus radiophilus TaxID=32062 RepID=A0A431W5L3_9DEIO|nr:MarR family transcriptional regulator [Deinococcus radiophilus]RTR30750.1 MarR family transcriptional regulator [Deinococcus radiophilus]UFA51304.1 hypothetical protein LMT64_05255 [Deinococcus radiophilus]